MQPDPIQTAQAAMRDVADRVSEGEYPCSICGQRTAQVIALGPAPNGRDLSVTPECGDCADALALAEILAAFASQPLN